MPFPIRRSCLIAVSVAAAAVLAGCLAAAPKIAPAERQALGPVAVTSRLGSEFHLRSIGFTVFQNQSAPQDVTDWQLDALLESRAVERITAAGVPGAQRLQRLEVDEKRATEALLAAAAQGGFRTLVTVEYLSSENQPFLNPGSFGIYSRANNTCLYAKFFVTVWNVADKTRRKGSPQIECQRIDGLVWKPALDQYSPQQRADIRQALSAQLTRQITAALGDTGLADAAPAR